MAEISNANAGLFVVGLIIVAALAYEFFSRLSFQELISLLLIPVELMFVIITFLSIYRKKNEVEREFVFDLMPRINLFFVFLIPVILWFQPTFAKYQTFLFWLEITGIIVLVGVPYWAVLHYFDSKQKRELAYKELGLYAQV